MSVMQDALFKGERSQIWTDHMLGILISASFMTQSINYFLEPSCAKGGYTTEKELSKFWRSRYSTALVSICVFFIRINPIALDYFKVEKRNEKWFSRIYEQIFRMEFKQYQTKPGCLIDFSPKSDIRSTIEDMLTPGIKHDISQPTYVGKSKERGKRAEKERSAAVTDPTGSGPVNVNELETFTLLHCVNSETGNEMVTLRNFGNIDPDAAESELLIERYCERMRAIANFTPQGLTDCLAGKHKENGARRAALEMSDAMSATFQNAMSSRTVRSELLKESIHYRKWKTWYTKIVKRIKEFSSHSSWLSREPHMPSMGYFLAQHIHR